MNKEELDLYIKLQPKLTEYRGPIFLPGDTGIIVYRGKQIEFLVYEAYVEGLLGGMICTITDDFGKVNFDCDDPALIWTPKAIDPDDHERIARGEKPRGLWGMVDWRRKVSNTSLRGDLVLMIEGKYIRYTPTHALLRALREQWKEEI